MSDGSEGAPPRGGGSRCGEKGGSRVDGCVGVVAVRWANAGSELRCEREVGGSPSECRAP